MNATHKHEVFEQIARAIGAAPEVSKIVVFGSFLNSETPNDIDIAVFQESKESYLPLALKYRRLAKTTAVHLPMDIIPLKPGAAGQFVDEINKGRVIYER